MCRPRGIKSSTPKGYWLHRLSRSVDVSAGALQCLRRCKCCLRIALLVLWYKLLYASTRVYLKGICFNAFAIQSWLNIRSVRAKAVTVWWCHILVCIRVLRGRRSEDTLSSPLWCDVHDHDVTREVRVLILRFELHIYVHYVQMLINLKNQYHRQSINQAQRSFHRFFHLCVMSSRVWWWWWWWHDITSHHIIMLGKAKALRSLSNGNQ